MVDPIVDEGQGIQAMDDVDADMGSDAMDNVEELNGSDTMDNVEELNGSDTMDMVDQDERNSLETNEEDSDNGSDKEHRRDDTDEDISMEEDDDDPVSNEHHDDSIQGQGKDYIAVPQEFLTWSRIRTDQDSGRRWSRVNCVYSKFALRSDRLRHQTTVGDS
jgi:hypothetical protein